jgi:hypothetical protein
MLIEVNNGALYIVGFAEAGVHGELLLGDLWAVVLPTALLEVLFIGHFNESLYMSIVAVHVSEYMMLIFVYIKKCFR